MNHALILLGVVQIDDYSNNEFDPSSWTLYVRYASTPPPGPGPTQPPPGKDYTLQIQVQGSGTTMPPPSTYVHGEDASVDVAHIPAKGWRLSNWILNGVTLDPTEPIRLTMNMDVALVAVFMEKPPNSTIYFATRDGNQSPIKGVTIETVQKPMNQAEITLLTDENGEAQTIKMRSGQYEFILVKKGYNTRHLQTSLDYDERLSITVHMETTTIDIALRLRDQQGYDISHTMVTATNTPPGQGQLTGITNMYGVVVFRDVLPGDYSFTAEGHKVLPKAFEYSSPEGEPASNYTGYVVSICSLKLRVLDEKGKPINDVRIEALTHPKGQSALSGVVNGEKTFVNIPPENTSQASRRKATRR